MRKLAAGACLALLVASAPLAVLAQAEPLDEDARATVVTVAQRTAAAVDPRVAAPVAAPVAAATDDPDDPAPMPEVEEPETEPTDEPVTLPELNLTDLIEYSSEGITFQAPADWIVETDIGEDTPFIIEVPGTDVFISMEADSGLDFPSWLGLALFRSQAELLISELGEEAQLVESVTLYTDQDLPMAKLEFIGVEGDDEMAGALFVTAPNEHAYLVIGGGPLDEWAYAEPGIDLIASSITFESDMIVVERAGDEPMLYDSEEAGVEVTVPAEWYVMSTGDPQFPVIAAEPEVRYVAAIGTEESFGGQFDPEILEVFTSDTLLDESEYEEVIADITDMLESAGTPIVVDEASSEVIAREGAVTVKLVGDAEVDEGLSMPIVFYIDMKSSGVGVVAIFGDTASALEVEADIQAMLESVATLE